MKVYVVNLNVVYDYEEMSGISDVKVFANRKDASDFFSNWKEEEKKIAQEDDWEIEVDDENFFSAYEDGYFARNHSAGCLMEVEL